MAPEVVAGGARSRTLKTLSPTSMNSAGRRSTGPLCRGHHRELHRHGDEAAWWENLGLDPTEAARALWLTTHPLPSAPNQDRL